MSRGYGCISSLTAGFQFFDEKCFYGEMFGSDKEQVKIRFPIVNISWENYL